MPWKLIYRDERAGARPNVVECHRLVDESEREPGIMVSLDLRRRTEERWHWARTYFDARGRIQFVRGRARSRAEALREAKGVAP